MPLDAGSLIRLGVAVAAAGGGAWMLNATLSERPPDEGSAGAAIGNADLPVTTQADRVRPEGLPLGVDGEADRSDAQPANPQNIDPRGMPRRDAPSEISVEAPGAPLQFVVKINGPSLEQLREIYLQDRAVARQEWQRYRDEYAELADLELASMTFGGELTLNFVGEMPEDPEARAALARQIAERLRQHPDVEFAEPNYRARLGKEELP